MARDVTEQKRAEEQIQASLHEKDVLLREIHHRVKNNLQIVISLLRLQSRKIVNEEALEAFADSEQRIRAMALLHETLHNSNDMGKINCQEYVGRLLDGLLQVQGKPAGVRLTADVADTAIALDHAAQQSGDRALPTHVGCGVACEILG